MSHTQNIFRAILSNDLVQSFQENYTAEDYKKMYLLTDEEAEELFYFVSQTEPYEDGYR